MIDNRNNTVHLQKHEEYQLAAPRFDERACANAQPVLPIPSGRISALVQRLRRVRPVINAKTRAFAIVVIAGLAVGALGGTIFVNQQATSLDEASVFDQPATQAPTSEDPQAVIESNITPAGALSGTENKVRPQRRYRRMRMPSPRRAYQVDVIR